MKSEFVHRAAEMQVMFFYIPEKTLNRGGRRETYKRLIGVDKTLEI